MTPTGLFDLHKLEQEQNIDRRGRGGEGGRGVRRCLHTNPTCLKSWFANEH